MKRIKYKIPPLVEVIFQLRFPTILSLNSEDPIEFQNKIRSNFPYYNITTQEIKEQRNDGQSRVIRTIKNHEFVSKDKKKKINLESTFIAFSTHSYSVWEDYISEIKDIVKIFKDIYEPAFYTRVGLRYIDVIQRSKWNLGDCCWSELINSDVLGFMKDDTTTYSMNAESKNNDGVSSTKYHFELAKINGTNEPVFLIDCDYYMEGSFDTENYINLSNNLHSFSRNFIQSAITQKLHQAMLPEDIEK